MPASKMRKPKCFTSWDDVPIILDVATAALILGMPYETVRKFVQNGTIPASKVGAEGQSSRSEGGISITFEDLPPLMRKRLENYPKKARSIRRAYNETL